MNIPVPKNEAKRISVLWQYDILDTVPEEVFDELANLAGLICGAPIALITMVDENRQWFKAKVGVDLEETSRDISMCTHAIMQSDLFVIPDTTKDDRFKNNPLVTEGPKIRFYAGAPLVTPDGHALGTLCVVDKVPRELNDNQLQALRVLARHVMIQLELRRHAKELTNAREDCTETKAELAKARLEIARLKKQKATKSPVKKKMPSVKKARKSAKRR